MKKVAKSYYAAAVPHAQIEGLFQGTFGIPGEPPMWVNDASGAPEAFHSSDEAKLAGFRCLVAKLNRSRQPQDFQVKGSPPPKNTIRTWIAPKPKDAGYTVESVFGKKQ
ncbi:hypothetical protein [Bradyrhizobium sp. SZCCHNS3053]|uniref:hypothetical protein n=1 Tax=Bradyrhizobium sp. SZCCHNS3053 TaxID=3057322 RepID=UPI002916AEAE|nr:hypothetical protein [Bradyrhizobium sp. SZCCHNS3053]